MDDGKKIKIQYELISIKQYIEIWSVLLVAQTENANEPIFIYLP